MPESAYQPKPEAMASPALIGNPSSCAASAPPASALTVTTTATIMPRRLSTIWRRVMPLLRNWMPTSNSRKINAYSLPLLANCNHCHWVRPSRKPPSTTPQSLSDSSAICRREGSFSCLWLFRHGILCSSSASISRLAARMHRKNTEAYWKISTRLLLRSSKNARLIPMKNRIT